MKYYNTNIFYHSGHQYRIFRFSLTKKYRNDGSAAAALAATIAAYAEEDDEAVTELDDGFDDIADEFDLDDIDVGDDEIWNTFE